MNQRKIVQWIALDSVQRCPNAIRKISPISHLYLTYIYILALLRLLAHKSSIVLNCSTEERLTTIA